MAETGIIAKTRHAGRESRTGKTPPQYAGGVRTNPFGSAGCNIDDSPGGHFGTVALEFEVQLAEHAGQPCLVGPVGQGVKRSLCQIGGRGFMLQQFRHHEPAGQDVGQPDLG